jgi:hypothetical protein
MDDVSKVLNTPVTVVFQVNGANAEYAFHELTIGEMAGFRSKLRGRAVSDWQRRLKLVAATIESERERRAYLLEAAATEPDWTAEVTRVSSTEDGIRWGLQSSASPALTDAVFAQINSDPENADALLLAINTCFGIRPETKTEGSTESNPPSPSPVAL